MAELTARLPVRRPELICWKDADNDRYVVRDRRAGAAYALGEEEHFLLERLDGRQTADDICRAFAERFGQPLCEEEFDEFIDLAGERGFLQSPDSGPAPVPPLTPVSRPVRPGARSLWRQLISRSLRAAAAVLQWAAGILNGVAGWIDLLRLKHLDYVPRPDDIFIVTYPRSGTTWMQMILYQLTTDGSMDFPHVAEYCPWFEKSLRSARGFETRPSPRLFKSHLAYPKIPKGPCRYIYVARNGRDVAVSYYHLYRRYNGYEGAFDQFFDLFLRGKVEFGSWFQHVKGWWQHRHDPNVLFLTYEELTGDLEGCVRRVIDFCGLDVPPERLPGILDRCRFAFMKQHESQFDPALETLWETGVQLNAFLRNGRTGEGAVQLNDDQAACFDQAQRRHWGPAEMGRPPVAPSR